ncbi:FMN-binding negative transcriptional regulator [Salinicola lusitanus]|uniref:FMN-binding negative transcriptional regulator n=1 Tax=Salinicola lusitanus TaxID=1949085 RepID=UPI000DA131E1|nr:FMN-binding negative transcriptional regulator [Salinicola lusitanus]
MYQPNPFRLDDTAAMESAIDQAPFATLITPGGGGGFEADHLPLLLETAGGESAPRRLRGHISRANPLADAPGAKVSTLPALAIFHGPQAYVSPSWYPAKREHGRVVPTWNYQVVHVRGRLRLIDDPSWLRELTGALTRRFERGRPVPWSIEDAPDDYIAGMCRAIIGVELTVERMEGKRKASQHKPREEREAIFQGLRGEYGHTAAEATILSGID